MNDTDNTALRVGIDLCALNPTYFGGVTSFSLDIVDALRERARNYPRELELVVFSSLHNAEYVRKTFPDQQNSKNVTLPVGNVFLWTNRIIAVASWLVRDFRLAHLFDGILRRRVRRIIQREVDILYTPTTLLNFTHLKIPIVVSIHDIQHEYLPHFFAVHKRVYRWARYRSTCHYATVIQVSSEFILRSIIEAFDFIPSTKIEIVPEGVSLRRFNLSNRATSPFLDGRSISDFVFYPAQLWPHKNHLLLVDALACVRDEIGREVTCVLTGADMGMLPAIRASLSDHGLTQCIYLGLVPQEQLIWLYLNCSCVLALGVYESSCLPIKEATALGKPVIAADIEPNVELGEEIELNIFVRDSVADLARRIIEVDAYRSHPAAMLAANREVIRNAYSWDKIAAVYIELFERLTRREPREC